MTPRARWLLGGVVVFSTCYAATHYDAWRYRGGALIDNGVFSVPRYEARFAEIPFDVPGTYAYEFHRFPGADAVVMLATPSAPAEASIDRLSTQLRVRVVSQDGQLLCDAHGSPDGKAAARFIVTSSSRVIGLWHASCARLQLQECDPCRLLVSVGPVDAATPRMMLVPALQGGGIELP